MGNYNAEKSNCLFNQGDLLRYERISTRGHCLIEDCLLELLNNNGHYSERFADDLATLLISNNSDAERCIYKVGFTRKRIQAFKSPKLFGKEIQPSEFVKYFGLLIDCKLLSNTKSCDLTS